MCELSISRRNKHTQERIWVVTTNGYLDFENEKYDYFEMNITDGRYYYGFGHEAGEEWLYADGLDESIAPLTFKLSGNDLSFDIKDMNAAITYTGKNKKQGKMTVRFSGTAGTPPK